jgi:hypothetical protein
MSRCKAPEILRVASRRIRSDSCHADESVSRVEAYLQMAVFQQPVRLHRSRFNPNSAHAAGSFQRVSRFFLAMSARLFPFAQSSLLL